MMPKHPVYGYESRRGTERKRDYSPPFHSFEPLIDRVLDETPYDKRSVPDQDASYGAQAVRDIVNHDVDGMRDTAARAATTERLNKTRNSLNSSYRNKAARERDEETSARMRKSNEDEQRRQRKDSLKAQLAGLKGK